MPEEAKLFETPKDIFFTLKDITFSPKTPRMKVPFTIKGKVELFGIPFYAPVWAIATVTYPEKWWEEIIPIIGGPEVREMSMVVGGDFEITFPKGFDREGEFGLAVRVYAGPTLPIDKITLPPFPPVATQETKFIVAGEVPPEEVGFRNFKIVSYSKNGSAPVTPPGVLELKTGDRLTINLGFDHRDLAVTAKIHAAIWQPRVWDPHDEVLFSEKSFSVPASDDWKPYPQGIDIVITSGIAPGKYGLYAKIMGITGGDIFTEYLTDVISIAGPPGLGFELTKPSVSATPVDPGTTIDITCPVKSTCTEPVDATAKVIIYEGSILPGHGAKIKDYDSGVFRINPGETKNVVVHHATIAGTIDRRDVEVEVYVGGQLIKKSEWDDVYYVTAAPPAEVIDFNLGQPTASPSQVSPGATVTITCPVTSACTKQQTATAVIKIYEGSALPGRGTLLDTKTSSPFAIAPGQTYNVTVQHPAVAGTIDRRDVGVEIYVGGQLIKKSEWDDVYYVTAAPPAEQYTLSVSVVPYTGGEVTKLPDKATYTKGEYVTLTASPSSGYEFDYWSGDASSYNASISLLMDKNKSVAAHFKKPLPDQRQIVSFTVHSKGPPYPTSYWILMHYNMDGALDFQSQVTPIETNIRLTGVMSGGYLSVFTSNAITGEWRVPQVDSVGFRATDGGEYTFDINTGIVYMGFI